MKTRYKLVIAILIVISNPAYGIDLYIDPYSIPEGYYEEVYILENESVFFTSEYTDIINVRIAPPIMINESNSYIPYIDYNAVIYGNNYVNAYFNRSGVYAVKLEKSDYTYDIVFVFVDAMHSGKRKNSPSQEQAKPSVDLALIGTSDIFLAFRYENWFFFDHVIDVDNVQEAINAINDRYKDLKKPIIVAIADHGGPGSQSIGSDTLAEHSYNFINFITSSKGKVAGIEFFGCEVAGGDGSLEEFGPKFIESIAQGLQIEQGHARGYTKEMYIGLYGVSNDIHGKWVSEFYKGDDLGDAPNYDKGVIPAAHRVWTDYLGKVDTNGEKEKRVDDGDDGIVFIKKDYVPGENLDIIVSFSSRGTIGDRVDGKDKNKKIYMNAWIDWDNDHKWDKIKEKVIGTDSTTGTQSFTSPKPILKYSIPIPNDQKPGTYWMRVRLDYAEDAGRNKQPWSDPKLDGPYGPALFGEVEDWSFIIIDNKDSPTIESSDSRGERKDIFRNSTYTGEGEYLIDNSVYVFGTNFQHNQTYNIYIINNKIWSPNDSIPTAIVSDTVTSDVNGTISVKKIWQSPDTGQYDIIVDVNNNRKYEPYIDALDDEDINRAGFIVISGIIKGYGLINISLSILAIFLIMTTLLNLKNRSITKRIKYE